MWEGWPYTFSRLIQNPQIPDWLDSHSLCWRKVCGNNFLALHLNCYTELPELITWPVQLRSYFSNLPNHHISKNSYDTKCNGGSFLTQNLNLCLFTKLCPRHFSWQYIRPVKLTVLPGDKGPIKLICAALRPVATVAFSVVIITWLSRIPVRMTLF